MIRPTLLRLLQTSTTRRLVTSLVTGHHQGHRVAINNANSPIRPFIRRLSRPNITGLQINRQSRVMGRQSGTSTITLRLLNRQRRINIPQQIRRRRLVTDTVLRQRTTLKRQFTLRRPVRRTCQRTRANGHHRTTRRMRRTTNRLQLTRQTPPFRHTITRPRRVNPLFRLRPRTNRISFQHLRQHRTFRLRRHTVSRRRQGTFTLNILHQ